MRTGISGWIDTWLRDRFALHDAASHRLTYIRGADVTDLSKYHKVVRSQQQYILPILLFQENYDHLSRPIDK